MTLVSNMISCILKSGIALVLLAPCTAQPWTPFFSLFLEGLVNPHIIWQSKRLFTLLRILFNDGQLRSGSYPKKKKKESQRHLAWFTPLLMSSYQCTWTQETTDEPPQKKNKYFWLKSRTVRTAFSVESHSSRSMLTLPPWFRSPLLPACLVRRWRWGWTPRAELTQIETAYVRGYTNQSAIRSWNRRE